MLRLSNAAQQFNKQKVKDFLFKTVAQQDRIIPWIGKKGDVTDPVTQARRNIIRTFGLGIMSYYMYYSAQMHLVVRHFAPITHDWSLLKTNSEVRRRAEETFRVGNSAHQIDDLLKVWETVEEKFYQPQIYVSDDPYHNLHSDKDAHWTQKTEKWMLEGMLYCLIKCSQFNHWYTENGYPKPFHRNLTRSRANAIMYPPINWFEYAHYPSQQYVEKHFIKENQFLDDRVVEYHDIEEQQPEINTGTNIISQKLFTEESRSKYHLKAEEIARKHGLKDYEKES